jgi:hypothetical protein
MLPPACAWCAVWGNHIAGPYDHSAGDTPVATYAAARSEPETSGKSMATFTALLK